MFLFNLYHVSRQSKILSGFIKQKLNSMKYEFSFISKDGSSYMLNTAIKFVTNLWKLNYTYFCHNAFKTSELIGATLLQLLSSFTLFTTFRETTKLLAFNLKINRNTTNTENSTWYNLLKKIEWQCLWKLWWFSTNHHAILQLLLTDLYEIKFLRSNCNFMWRQWYSNPQPLNL